MSNENQTDKMKQVTADLAKEAFGRTPAEAAAEGVCISCGKTPGIFKDEVSVREWRISRFCQACQDDFFG